MPRKQPARLKCPTCKEEVKNRSADFPFCSERCRLIDLGKWASGAYRIASPVSDISEDAPQAEDES
jgi:hypothetical protein